MDLITVPNSATQKKSPENFWGFIEIKYIILGKIWIIIICWLCILHINKSICVFNA